MIIFGECSPLRAQIMLVSKPFGAREVYCYHSDYGFRRSLKYLWFYLCDVSTTQPDTGLIIKRHIGSISSITYLKSSDVKSYASFRQTWAYIKFV
jgi:hypothetical protein